jgi:hypothetical protein
MAYPNNWIVSGGNVLSFCEYADVTDRDQRLFEANEGIADSGMIEDFAERATTKILYEIKDTAWWQSYFLVLDGGTTNVSTLSTIDVPVPSANKFQARQQDWTDLTVFLTLYEYVLPKVADFSNEDNAEYKKIGFYREKYQSLFRTLINAGDWYDFDGLGTISNQEKMPTRTNIVRIR